MAKNHYTDRAASSAGETLQRFSTCVAKQASECSVWAQKNGISCYRVYDAQVIPYAVSIDVYKGAAAFAGQAYLVISQYRSSNDVDESTEAAVLDDAISVASYELGVSRDHIFTKARHHDRSGSQYKDGQREPFIVYTQESGYFFEVDLEGYLDTGIFLDHRPMREMIGQTAGGLRFLNLFAYTGTATVHAAGAKALSTTTVDLSQTYLNWAQRNMQTNGFEGEAHRFIRSDAIQWLDRDIRKGTTYDLVFVDPPTFSHSKLKGKKTWSVARDHVELLKKVTAVLSPNGKAFFSCNLRNFKPNIRALEQEGIKLTDITAQSIPKDFAQNPTIHHCYLVNAE